MNTSTGDRSNYTVYSSTDGGREWAWVVGVYSGPSGYSDMTFLPDGNLAVGFQRGGAPKFAAGQAGTSLALAIVELPLPAQPDLPVALRVHLNGASAAQIDAPTAAERERILRA